MPNLRDLPPVILVVEDDPVLAVVLERLVGQVANGYDVIVLTYGREALACFEQRDVALVITDYHLLSSMDGLRLSRAIKQRSPETRIVLITAYATADMERRAREHGIDYYLPKPFLLNDMEQVIRKSLG